MTPAHRRHDISDKVWKILEPHLLGRKGTWGGNARDNRLFINAVFWILRTGAPWRDLPPDYGDWKNTHRRFCRWRDKGVWEHLLEVIITEPDFEWLMNRRKPYKSTPSRIRSCRRQSGYGSYKRGLNTKIHLAVDAHGMPVRMFITSGTVADCRYGEALIEGIDAGTLLADKGYDTDAIIEAARNVGMDVVIPPKKNRKVQRDYDKYIYRLRHLVENAFLELKRWRGIATRYAKNTSSFLAAVHIRCINLWTKIY